MENSIQKGKSEPQKWALFKNRACPALLFRCKKVADTAQ